MKIFPVIKKSKLTVKDSKIMHEIYDQGLFMGFEQDTD